MISLVTVNYNDSKTVAGFVEMAVRFSHINHIIVVDNGSTDGSFEELKGLEKRYGKVTVIQSGKNGGYGYGNNRGIQYAAETYHSDFIVVANPDVRFDDHAVYRMKEALDSHRDCAAAAPVMHDRKGRSMLQTAWRVPKSGWGFILMDLPLARSLLRTRYYYDIQKLRPGPQLEVDAVAGALLMLRAADFIKAGYYDEALFLYCEESVLAMKLQAVHKRSLLLTDVCYVHEPSTTIHKTYRTFAKKVRLLWESKETVLKKYYGFDGLRLKVCRLAKGYCCIYAFIRGFLP